MAKPTYTREQNLATLRSISFPFQKTPESYSTSYLARNASAVRRAEAEGREYSRKVARGHKEEGGKGKGKEQTFKATPNPATLKHVRKTKSTPDQWLITGGKNTDALRAKKTLRALRQFKGASVTVAVQGTFINYSVEEDTEGNWKSRRGSKADLTTLMEKVAKGKMGYLEAMQTWWGPDLVEVDAISIMKYAGERDA